MIAGSLIHDLHSFAEFGQAFSQASMALTHEPVSIRGHISNMRLSTLANNIQHKTTTSKLNSSSLATQYLGEKTTKAVIMHNYPAPTKTFHRSTGMDCGYLPKIVDAGDVLWVDGTLCEGGGRT